MKHVLSGNATQLDLSFVQRNGRTVLDRRLFSYPYVLMRTFSEPSATVRPGSNDRPAALTHLIVQNSSGPVHDRDDLATRLVLDASTRVLVTYQGATTVHRARLGNQSREHLSINLGPGSHLSYLPEARIYFPDASHRQVTDIELSHGNSLIFFDGFTVHDPDAVGRRLRELDNTLTVRRDGETVLLDRQHLVNPLFERGYRAFGTILLLGRPAPKLPEIAGLYAAVSALPSGLGWAARLAAPDLRPIRAATAVITGGG